MKHICIVNTYSAHHNRIEINKRFDCNTTFNIKEN